MSSRTKLDNGTTIDWRASTSLGRAIKNGEACGVCTIRTTGKRDEELARCKVIGRVYARADGIVAGIMRCPFAPTNPTMVVPAAQMAMLGNVDLKRFAAACVGIEYVPTPLEEVDED